ncbi:MAG: YiiX/YebB-like N1pC/P60 family cysteine hydrolase [Arenicellales bacterium]
MLSELLREPLESALSGPDTCLERARQVGESYRLLNREQVGAADLLELKFASMNWRRNLLARLGEDPPPWLSTDDSTLGDIVGALNCRLTDEAIVKLARKTGPKPAHYLLALQGERSANAPEHHALAGPGITLKIQANRNSAWPFERWKRKPEFSVYEFADGGVNFRGVHFLPGDVLLSNVNIDGNGVYTTLSDPTRFSSHAAVFAILEDGGRRYPAVVETYEKGVRAVPLNVFLGPRFCAYVEVYRHKDLEASHGAAINRAAIEMMSRARGYNFDSRSDDPDYVSCCSVGRQIHLDAGLRPVRPRSTIENPAIRANLEKLEFTFFDFFAPVDYLLDDNFKCVGWVDNHQFPDLLARELVEAYFRELFATRTLNPKRLPLMGHINRWGIGHIRRQTVLGKAISAVEGFDDVSLPRGPAPLMAVITIVEAQLGKVVKQTRRWLDSVELPEGYFSLSEFSRRPAVRHHLESSLKLAWLE